MLGYWIARDVGLGGSDSCWGVGGRFGDGGIRIGGVGSGCDGCDWCVRKIGCGLCTLVS